tara:strand:+ start:1187 stop:1456 length:270 start_codon:yes stop_codon:yes gene_type:complete
MAAPVFTPLPASPNRETSPASFSDDADAFLGALPTFQTQGNSLGTYCETQANDAATSAATISSTVTVYTNESSFNSATPTDGQLFVLSI